MKAAIILGSGVSFLENETPKKSFSYAELGFPVTGVKGHKGRLEIYQIKDTELWVLRGRAHIYEGYSWQQAAYPTKYLIENGIKKLFITNAAGGLDPSFNVGDLMQITGYLNFMQPDSPRGNLDALLQSPVKFSSKKIAVEHEGVYVGFHGTCYETLAEVDLFRSLGGSAVGMSTIPEIETALAAGLDLQAVSVITNVYRKTEELGHEGVVEAAQAASEKLEKLVLAQL